MGPAIPLNIRERCETDGEGVAIGELVTVVRVGDRIVMDGSPTGQHSIDWETSDDERVQAHVKGYVNFTYTGSY